MTRYYLYIFLTLFIFGCGEKIVNIDSTTYEPKIYIYGIIFPGKSVEDIKIERNFPLNTKVDLSSLAITDADVIITDLSTTENYKLNYNPITKKYDCLDLVIKEGVNYRLSVSATIDGKNVRAYGTTNVPKGRITINKELSKLETFSYEEKDIDGDYKYFEICWDVSSDIDVFRFGVEAVTYFKLDLGPGIILGNRPTSQEYLRYLIEVLNWTYIYSYWDTPVNPVNNVIFYQNNYTNNSYSLRIEGYDLGLIEKFKVVISYNTEEYNKYLSEPKEARDVDGNFMPVKNFINGDGVGFFGSRILEYSEELIMTGRESE